MRRTHLSTVRLTPNKEDRVQVCCFGDIHLGAKTCDIDLATTTVNRCVEKKIYIVGMGDMLECATRYSVGAGIYEQTMSIQDQMEMLIGIIKPAQDAGLLLGLHTGNHEFRITKETGLNITTIMCQQLGCRYLNHSAFHLWYVGKNVYTAHTTHGSSGARLAYTKLKAALDVFRYTDVDIVAYGHLHGLDHMTALFSGIDRRAKKVVNYSRHAVLTGSYLRYKGSYAEQKNLPPVQMGSPIISLYGDEHRIHVSL